MAEVLLPNVERHRHVAHRRPGAAARRLLLLSPNVALLLERGKWAHNRALRLNFDEILSHRETPPSKPPSPAPPGESLLLPGSGPGLPDRLDENSPKHAFGVSEDLKYALRKSIELISNEAIRHLHEVSKEHIYALRSAAVEFGERRKLRRARLRCLPLPAAGPRHGQVPRPSPASGGGASRCPGAFAEHALEADGVLLLVGRAPPLR